MNATWYLDSETRIEVKVSVTARVGVLVNGEKVAKGTQRKPIPFALPDGASGRIEIKRPFIGAPKFTLFVDDVKRLQTPKRPLTACPACQGHLNKWDRFCESCGHDLLKTQKVTDKIKQARYAILWLAGGFVIFGFIAFASQQAEMQQAITNLQGLDPEMVWPEKIGGVSMTVAELRAQVNWEVYGGLTINLMLAAIMVGLSFWAKKKPVPALMVACAAFAAVVVGNAIVDPMTLAEGFIGKMVVIALLGGGLKAALEARAAANLDN